MEQYNDCYVEYAFHPVGQGLFASGHLMRLTESLEHAIFSWVFDCGASGGLDYIGDGIDRVVARCRGQVPVLNLVVLSHFDNDHINGVTQLLTRCSVDTLLIPLLPLWKRLLLIFDEKRYLSKNALAYCLDPLGAILRLEGSRIRRIVLVPPSNGEALPPGDQIERDGEENPDDDLRLPRNTVELTRDFLPRNLPGSPTRIFELPQGGILRWRDAFEFVPYNEAEPKASVDAAFIAEATIRQDSLLSASTASARKDALKNLKRLYELKFARGRPINEISLHLYAGALSRSSHACMALCHRPAQRRKEYEKLRLFLSSRNSMLYTGDGYFDDAEKWRRLEIYLGQSRVGNLAGLQVAHHGSRRNWHRGLAAKINPDVSIFSSDPDRYGHPHQSVRRDFASVSTVLQVDKMDGWALFAGPF